MKYQEEVIIKELTKLLEGSLAGNKNMPEVGNMKFYDEFYRDYSTRIYLKYSDTLCISQSWDNSVYIHLGKDMKEYPIWTCDDTKKCKITYIEELVRKVINKDIESYNSKPERQQKEILDIFDKLDTNKTYKTGTLVFIEKSDIEKFQLSNLENMDIFVKKAINKNGEILKGKDVDESNLQGFILFNGNYKNC